MKSSPQLKDEALRSRTFSCISDDGYIPGSVDSTPDNRADNFLMMEKSHVGPARTISSRPTSTTASASGSNVKCLTVSEAGPSLSAVSTSQMIYSNS